MNSKNIIIFISGFSAGCIFMKQFLKADMERRLDEEYREMDERLQREYEKEKGPKGKEGLKGRDGNIMIDEAVNYDPIEKKVFRSEIRKNAYDSYFNAPPEEKEHPEDDDADKKPRLISYEEFSEDRTFDRVSLIYYSTMDLLCEENEIIDDADEVVGDIFKDAFETGGSIVEPVYVRNGRLGINYEINYDDSDAEFVRESLGLDG